MSHATRALTILSLGFLLICGSSSRLLADPQEDSVVDEDPVVEVRVYKVAEGKMDEWERFFHDKLVEPQERAGIKVLSAYRTLGDENLFVWSRQFSSKANMQKEQDAFYQSNQWKEVLLPELKQQGLIEKVEIVYTVRPSK